MKHLFMLLLGCFCINAATSQKNDKIALIVAVGNYSTGSNWAPTSAGNDAALMVSTLIRQGFKQENIRVLKDEAATKAGIKNAIQTSLTEKAAAGGTALLYFSGHGQQVKDNDNDEADGFDEAAVPFDSPKDYRSGVYEGTNLIRDDDFNRWLAPVREKLGPTGRQIIVFEASYSGGSTRGKTEGRSADVVMASPEFIESLKTATTNSAFESLDFDANNAQNMAPISVILAAPAGQAYETIDNEGKPIGALIYAFSRSLANATPGTTYAQFMHDIRRILSLNAQVPGFDGDNQAKVLGGLVAEVRHFAISDVNVSSKLVHIDGGMLQGVLNGSQMALYPASISDTNGVHPLAFGTVVSSGLLTAELELRGNFSNKQIKKSRAWLRNKNFGNLKVDLFVNIEDADLKGKIIDQCKALPFVRMREQNTDLQLIAPEPGLLELQTRNGFVLYNSTDEDALSGSLIDQIRQHAQAQLFREMTTSGDSIPNSMELIPVKLLIKPGKIVEQARYTIADYTDTLGNIRFKTGEHFKLRIKNQGDKPAYFTVLYIRPNDDIRVLAPQATDPAEIFLLNPGESRECEHYFAITRPEGIGALKCISSEKPLDLTEILATKGKLMRSESKQSWNEIELFFAETFQNTTFLPTLPPAAAQISTLIFSIGNQF